MISDEDKKRYVKLCLKKQALYAKDAGAEEDSEIRKQVEEVDRQIKRMFSYLCGIPEKFKHVVMWMVDVQAASTCGAGDVQKLMSQAADDGLEHSDAIRRTVAKIGGELYENVSRTLERNGFRISDRGGGLSGWHVGVWCTSEDADRMVELIRREYKEEIENYVIALRRMPWSLGFKGLHFVDEILEYAKEHGIEP